MNIDTCGKSNNSFHKNINLMIPDVKNQDQQGKEWIVWQMM